MTTMVTNAATPKIIQNFLIKIHENINILIFYLLIYIRSKKLFFKIEITFILCFLM